MNLQKPFLNNCFFTPNFFCMGSSKQLVQKENASNSKQVKSMDLCLCCGWNFPVTFVVVLRWFGTRPVRSCYLTLLESPIISPHTRLSWRWQESSSIQTGLWVISLWTQSLSPMSISHTMLVLVGQLLQRTAWLSKNCMFKLVCLSLWFASLS